MNKSCESNAIEKIDQILLGSRRRHEECNEGTREEEYFPSFYSIRNNKKKFACTKCKIALESAHLAPRPSSFSALQEPKARRRGALLQFKNRATLVTRSLVNSLEHARRE